MKRPYCQTLNIVDAGGERLSGRQRQIMFLMREHGTAVFGRGIRGFRFGIAEDGLVIHAYQNPEFFLKVRGLIEYVEDSNRGFHCYRLTPVGAARAEKLSAKGQDWREL